MKNILHISTSDSGGAGLVAYKFHKAIENMGINSKMLVMEKSTDDESVIQVETNKLIYKINSKKRKLEEKIGLINSKYYFYDKMNYSVNSDEVLERYIDFKPDVIVLGWITNFVDLKIIKKIANRYQCKVFWYIMDMAPITGGCHIIWDCSGYKNKCIDCPAVKFPFNKLPRKNYKNKIKFLKNLNIELLYTVPWVEELLNQSPLYRDSSKHFMPVFFKEELFNINNNTLRKKYSIPNDKKVILFGANTLEDKRKGFKYFLKSLKKLQNNCDINNILIVLIGKGDLDLKKMGININFKNFGFIKTQKELSEIYKISDLFVSPVLADIGPSMVIESMLCGVPCVSFNQGVAQDIIQHMESGYIAEFKNSDDIAKGINYVLDLNKKEYNSLSIKARESAFRLYSNERFEKQLEKFIKII